MNTFLFRTPEYVLQLAETHLGLKIEFETTTLLSSHRVLDRNTPPFLPHHRNLAEG
jgi:hypothetical protein